MHKLSLFLFLSFLTLLANPLQAEISLHTNPPQYDNLSSNIMRRVNAITLDIDKADDALKRDHSSAFKTYINSAEKEFNTIFQHYPDANPEHPVLKGLKHRMNTLLKQHDSPNKIQISAADSISNSSMKKVNGNADKRIKYLYSEVYDAMTDKTLHSFKSNQETTIKSGINKLSYASDSDILVAFKNEEKQKVIDSIELQLNIVRAQLFSATKGSQVLTITPKELIMMKPIIPITVRLKGNRTLLSIIQKKYNKTQKLETALNALDESHFPAVMNVENYQLIQYFQMQQ